MRLEPPRKIPPHLLVHPGSSRHLNLHGEKTWVSSKVTIQWSKRHKHQKNRIGKAHRFSYTSYRHHLILWFGELSINQSNKTVDRHSMKPTPTITTIDWWSFDSITRLFGLSGEATRLKYWTDKVLTLSKHSSRFQRRLYVILGGEPVWLNERLIQLIHMNDECELKRLLFSYSPWMNDTICMLTVALL